MFYYSRYIAHFNAMRIADKQRQEASAKGDTLVDKFNVRSQDTKFLTDASEQLINVSTHLFY